MSKTLLNANGDPITDEDRPKPEKTYMLEFFVYETVGYALPSPYYFHNPEDTLVEEHEVAESKGVDVPGHVSTDT
jgi:hypothetical protein